MCTNEFPHNIIIPNFTTWSFGGQSALHLEGDAFPMIIAHVLLYSHLPMH